MLAMTAQRYTEVLAQAVKDRRRELGYARARDLADAMGMSVQTVNLIEASRRESYSEGTLLALDRALSWDYGSARRILTTGVDPQQLDEAGPVSDTDPMVLDIPIDAVVDLTPTEIAEVKSAAVLAYLSRVRDIRASRGGGSPSGPNPHIRSIG